MSDYSAMVLARPGLVGLWRQADTSGTAMTDAAAVPHNGAYTGGFALGQGGALAGALDTSTSASFDGSSGVGTVPDDPALDFASDLSVTAFLYLIALPGSSKYFVSKLHLASVHGWAIGVNSSGQLLGSINNSTGVGGSIPVGKWCHVAMVLDDTGLLRKIYVNGVLVDNSAVPSAVVPTTAVGLTVGSGLGTFANVRLQEVAYYNRQLSAAEITQDAAYLALAFNQPRRRLKAAIFEAGFGVRRTPVNDAGYTASSFDAHIAYTALTAPRTVLLKAGLFPGQRMDVTDEVGAAGTYPITINNPDASLAGTVGSDGGSWRGYWNGAKWATLAAAASTGGGGGTPAPSNLPLQQGTSAAQLAAENASLPATTTLDTVPAPLADVSANGHKIVALADATADTDALNRRTADARYGGSLAASTVIDQATSPKDIDSTGVADGDALVYSAAAGLYVPVLLSSGGGGGGTSLVPTAVKTASYGPAANDLARYSVAGGSISDVLPNAPADGTIVAVKLVTTQTSPIGSSSSAGTLNSLTINTQGSDTFATGGTAKKFYALGHGATFQYKATDHTWTTISADLGTTSPWCCVGPATNVSQTSGAVGFCIDASGIVRLRGYVTSTAAIAAATTLWTLPFAPTQLVQFDQVYAAVSGLIPQVTTSGQIQPKGTWNSGLYGNLDGKSFATT